jgi:hypothetical protein
MTRRELFHKLALSVAGALVALNFPIRHVRKVVDSSILTESVVNILTNAFNDYTKGKGWNQAPKWIVVGSDLMNAFEGELMVNQRFIDVNMASEGYRSLKFKSLSMVSDGPGWHYEFMMEKPTWLSMKRIGLKRT